MHSQTGRVKRQKLQTEVRQEQIIEAAMNLIASRGLKGLSVAALATRIGLVPVGHLPPFQDVKKISHILDMVLDFVRERLLTSIRDKLAKRHPEPMEAAPIGS